MTSNRDPRNTLMGLPDELLVKVIKHAVSSDEVIQIGPDTFGQDYNQVRNKVLAPFQGIPHLLSIAEEEFDEGRKLNYRLSYDHLIIRPWLGLETCRPRIASDKKDLYILTEDGEIYVAGTDASHVRHLDITAAFEPITGNIILQNNSGVMAAEMQWPVFLGQISHTFPDLTTLTLKVTTYSIGRKSADFWDLNSGQTWAAHQRPDVTAAQFHYRLGMLIRALRSYDTPMLKHRSLLLCQETSRNSRTWRDGPVRTPGAQYVREDFEALGVYQLSWQMMDFRCSRLDVGTCRGF